MQSTSYLQHPYYPTTLVLPDFEANGKEAAVLLSYFTTLIAGVLAFAWVAGCARRSYLTLRDQSVYLWFVLCGSIHVFFEGYLVLNHGDLSSRQDLFGQLWKEYALSDSRYLTSDSVVLCAELITVIIWGPLSWMAAIATIRSSAWRHPLQLIVSIGHFYGDLLYLSSSFADRYIKGIQHSRPEAYYLWFYFFFLNAIWLAVPGVLIVQSVTCIKEAFEGWDEVARMYNTSGTIGNITNGNTKVGGCRTGCN